MNHASLSPIYGWYVSQCARRVPDSSVRLRSIEISDGRQDKRSNCRLRAFPHMTYASENTSQLSQKCAALSVVAFQEEVWDSLRYRCSDIQVSIILGYAPGISAQSMQNLGMQCDYIADQSCISYHRSPEERLEQFPLSSHRSVVRTQYQLDLEEVATRDALEARQCAAQAVH